MILDNGEPIDYRKMRTYEDYKRESYEMFILVISLLGTVFILNI